MIFSLCRKRKKLSEVPKNNNEWFSYLSRIEIQVGSFKLSAFEIEHAILRANMTSPEIPVIQQSLITPPKFHKDNPKRQLIIKTPQKLINFVLFLPNMY